MISPSTATLYIIPPSLRPSLIAPQIFPELGFDHATIWGCIITGMVYLVVTAVAAPLSDMVSAPAAAPALDPDPDPALDPPPTPLIMPIIPRFKPRSIPKTRSFALVLAVRPAAALHHELRRHGRVPVCRLCHHVLSGPAAATTIRATCSRRRDLSASETTIDDDAYCTLNRQADQGPWPPSMPSAVCLIPTRPLVPPHTCAPSLASPHLLIARPASVAPDDPYVPHSSGSSSNMRLVDDVGSLDIANAMLIVLYAGFHALGAGPLTRLYIEEILPHRLKVRTQIGCSKGMPAVFIVAV